MTSLNHRILRTLLMASILAMLFFFFAMALFAFTTDSEISPQELGTWQVVRKTMPDAEGFYYIVAENPELRLDPLICPIKYVLLSIDSRKQAMVAYAYYRDDELMIFEIVWKDLQHTDGQFQRIYRIAPEARRLIDWFLRPFLKKFKNMNIIEET